jgi:hypothetical protein
MRRFLLSLLLVLGFSVPAAAQLGSVPFVFEPDTVISSSEVNTNFATVYSNALLRTGGTMTGTFSSRDLVPTADNTYDIGSGSFAYQDGFFDGALTAGSLDVAGAIIAGSGNVTIIGSDGRLPAISSTYFADLSGVNLTGVARLASAESISGVWSWANSVSIQGRNLASTVVNMLQVNSANSLVVGPTDAQVAAAIGVNTTVNGSTSVTLRAGNVNVLSVASTGLTSLIGSATVPNTFAWKGLNTATSAVSLVMMDATNFALFGPPDSEVDAGCCLETILRGGGIILQTNNTTRTTIGASDGTFKHFGAFGVDASITASTLSGGENHNYNPTGLSTAYTVRVAGNAITPSKITGISGGFPGREIDFCNTGTDLWSFKPEDSDSTSSNRIAGELSSEYVLNPETCATVKYDGASSRWRVKAGAQPMSPL